MLFPTILKKLLFWHKNLEIIEIDLTNKKFTKQLEKASKIAKFAIILGEEELEKNMISVKNLSTGNQTSINRSECCNFINCFIQKNENF